MHRSVGVVVPAYRPDPDRLATYLREVVTHLDPAVVRVELDDPRSETLDRLADLPVDVNAAPSRRGKGAAVTAGFEALDTDVLAFADADGSTPVSSLSDVLDPVVTGDADLSVGSRRHPDATVVSHQTFARRRLGDGFAWLARRLLDVPLYDYQCGAKAASRETWESVREHLYEPGFAWDIELVAVAAALGHRVVERPVVWEDQPGSTVDPVNAVVRLGRGLLVSRHRARLLRENRLHALLDSRRPAEPALIHRYRPTPDVTDE